MKYSISLSGDAENDLDESFLWYELQKLNLGIDFIKCINEYLVLLQKYPEAFPLVYNNVRRVISKKFPYSVYYTINEKDFEIEVLAILHNSHSPDVVHGRS